MAPAHPAPPRKTGRRRARALIGRLRERAARRANALRDRARRAAPMRRRRSGPGKMRKRKAALALSAGAVGLTAALTPYAPDPARAAAVAVDPDVRRPAVLLHASDSLKEAMIEEEGARFTVYNDPAGFPTVGVGHLVTPDDNLKVGQRIGEDRVLDLFEQDLRIAEAAVVRLLGPTPVNQNEFDALVDLVFNVGEGNVSPDKSPQLNAAIAARDYQAIADELDYHHAAGGYLEGLALRSERRSNIFLEASYDDPRLAVRNA